MDAGHTKGRNDLVSWLEAQPKNFYEADPLLQFLMESAGTPDQIAALRDFGAVAAGPLDAAAIENNRHPNLPWLDSWDGIGRNKEQIGHHPSYHEAGKYIYGSGVMAAYQAVPNPHRFILSLFYLSAQVGEAGHNCPLACTAGAIRSIQALGTSEQKAQWLPGLLNPTYGEHFSASQFLTEVQGGSDVGLNSCRATPEPDGTYRIWGEKWFCSSADAQVFIMTARRDDGPTGTPGLSLFLVPRERDGKPNGFRLRRLKDKLGTRSMASAEIDFVGAWAQPLGPLEGGFQNIMHYVITTSRLYNAFGCAGLAQRACHLARTYAQHRIAFGRPIGQYPLVQETLACMRSDTAACLAGSFWLAELQERFDAGTASEDEKAFLRVAININKSRTAELAHQVIHRGVEVLAGNGTIESFSVLPRLLRDHVVFENWEGTHNVLCLQVTRDAARLDVHQGFFRVLEQRLPQALIQPIAAEFDQAVATRDTLMARRVCARMGSLILYAALSQQNEPSIKPLASLFCHRHLSDNALNDSYKTLIEKAS